MSELQELLEALRSDQNAVDVLADQFEAQGAMQTAPKAWGEEPRPLIQGSDFYAVVDDVTRLSEQMVTMIELIEAQQTQIDSLRTRVQALTRRR